MEPSESLRIMGERYVSLAETTSDPAERQKYLAYAQAYADWSEQVAERDRANGEAPGGAASGKTT